MVRHGQTAWSAAGRHTSRTDLGLAREGRDQALAVGRHLRGLRFARVWTSPLLRSRQTCDLAGFGRVAEVVDDLREWDYGEYEGRTTADIRRERPDWSIWREGAPGGETPAQVACRADRVVATVRQQPGDVLVFAHAHVLRVVAARWLGLAPEAGAWFVLDPATLSVLGWEREVPAVLQWNAPPDTSGEVGADR